MANSGQTGYAAVNGINLYYEIYGEGKPLVMMPGGFMTVASWVSLVETFAKTRQVIAVELQGHGHTADIDRPLTIEAMADDIAGLLKFLEVETADVLGYSLGGDVAWQVGIRHPEAVNKMVVISSPHKRSAWYPEALDGMQAMNAEEMKATPIYEEYQRVSPQPERWPTFVNKLRDLLAQDYDWSQDIAGLKTPTMVVVADADGFSPAHAVEMYTLLGGGKGDVLTHLRPASRLAILPGATHYDIMMGVQIDKLVPIVNEFLDAPPPQPFQWS